MNVLITAGGTAEPIDAVRSITNKSTGRLGSLIADHFAQNGAQITYVCGETAVLPVHKPLAVINVKTVSALNKVLEERLCAQPYDCVIHAMAVSDFTVQGMFSMVEMAEAISEALKKPPAVLSEMKATIVEAMEQSVKPMGESKISSEVKQTALVLRQNPKVIARIKKLQPDTVLVGFKLLSGVTEEALYQAGYALLKKNNCDFVLANDLADIHNETHRALLINANGIAGRADTKQEIAQLICRQVIERIHNL